MKSENNECKGNSKNCKAENNECSANLLSVFPKSVKRRSPKIMSVREIPKIVRQKIMSAVSICYRFFQNLSKDEVRK
jgi:hypothetical protein